MRQAASERVNAQKRAGLQRGYVQVYTGNGKGKTTAAVGLAVRAVGAGLKVYIAQFMKDGSSSELHCLEQLTNRIKIDSFLVHACPDAGTPENGPSSKRWQNRLRKIFLSRQYDIVILEEANMAVMCGLVSPEDILSMIAAKPSSVELVITGRYAHPDIIQRADLVTEMKQVKHYYQNGVKARMGIEH
jgi:cob(I)alamin adenosyltransferase